MTTQVNVNSPQRMAMEQKHAEMVHSYHESEEFSEQSNDTDYNQISYDNLRKIHSSHMENGTSFIAATPELVDMLGGIDQILTDYLKSSNRMLLNEIQRQRIHQVLSKPPLQDHKNESPKDYRYLFLIQSTSIHLCLNKQKAIKFINFIFHYLTILFFTILGLILLIFKIGIQNITQQIWFKVYQLIMYSLSLIWLLFALLITNKSALCVVAKTFEFMLKLLLTIFAILMEYIWFFVVNNNNNNNNNTSMDRLVVYISWLVILLLIIIFSSLDALYVKLWVKSYIGFIVCVILIAHTWTISYMDNNDIIEIVGTSISLGSLAVSAFQFLLLFVIKQSILSMLKKEKIISVKSSPYVQWVNDSDDVDKQF